ncbi:MAG: SpoIIE family protein phosphatase, partial [Ignavibacteriales bacterium]|nr:SpoIIE family protein phosphatase [Ignavibacteriales bacterium]
TSVNKRASAELLPLFEFSNIVNSSLDLSFILDTVLRTLMAKMLVGKGIVFLRDAHRSFSVLTSKGVKENLKTRTWKLEGAIRTITSVAAVEQHSPALGSVLRACAQEVVIPIVSRRDVVGIISLGARLPKKAYSKIDRQLIQSLVNLSGAAVEKALIIEQVKETNRSLDRKYQELNTLFDLSKEFNIGMDQDRVVRLITFALLGQVGAKNYAICLRGNEGMSIVASRLLENLQTFTALQPLCKLRKAMLIEDLLRQKDFRSAAVVLHQLSIKAVIPMHIQNQTRGAVLLGERLRGGAYTKADLEFLYSLGNLAIISIENARLFKEAIEKQRLEDELNIAREIQQGLLPEILPSIAGFDIAAMSVSSKQVGGDYYDAIARRGKEFVLAIGDVSGKGTPAALLMASVQAALRALAPMDSSLSEITHRINGLTCDNNRGGSRFITFFWGILDSESKMLRYVNAGHNPPFLFRRDGSISRLDEGGLILGILKNPAQYVQGEVLLQKGDALVMFTDGVSEAMNASGEDFTEERLVTVLNRVKEKPANEIIQATIQAVEAHTQGTPQSDDMTMLVLKAL